MGEYFPEWSSENRDIYDDATIAKCILTQFHVLYKLLQSSREWSEEWKWWNKTGEKRIVRAFLIKRNISSVSKTFSEFLF